MKIIIATGIYPPEIGGPSEYARQLFETLIIQNHDVQVVTYGELKQFPTGLRHILYFCKLTMEAISADYIIALDTFSVALPALVFSKLFGKKMIVRVAGDFLWESYVSRTHEDVLLSKFYSVPREYTLKEKIISILTRLVFAFSSAIVFSTEWQKNIMMKPYNLFRKKTYVIENFFPESVAQKEFSYDKKIFLSPSRDIHIKNKERLMQAFQKAKERYEDIELVTNTVSREVLMEKMKDAYAVLVTSFSEVSPNLVMDALQYSVPVVVTEDTGIAEKLKDMAIFVNPFSTDEIALGIEKLLDKSFYDAYRHRIMMNTYKHSWNEIAQEFLDVYEKIK
ncbi:MAG: glycosyltransferase family 4 protein [bacterium]